MNPAQHNLSICGNIDSVILGRAPSVTNKRGRRRRGFDSALRGRYATERAVNAMGIVIVFVFAQLARQVDGIPEEHAVKILSPDRPD